jgi:hypothetical protein
MGASIAKAEYLASAVPGFASIIASVLIVISFSLFKKASPQLHITWE